MTRHSQTRPVVMWSVKWLMLALAFAWLVGCSAMNKNMQDPFLSSSNPDEFSCGESHRGSGRSARAAKAPTTASRSAATQQPYAQRGSAPGSTGMQNGMQYGMTASRGMEPALPGEMSREYGAANRVATKPAAASGKSSTRMNSADVEDPFAADEFADADNETTGRVSF